MKLIQFGSRGDAAIGAGRGQSED